jgi:hypothetical protein
MQNIRILMNRGKHQHLLPKGTEELILEVLEKVGVTEGSWKVQFGANVTGRAHMPKVLIGPFKKETNSILLSVKPGDNGTRNECILYIPASHRDNAVEFYDLLKKTINPKVEEQTVEEYQQEVEMKAPVEQEQLIPQVVAKRGNACGPNVAKILSDSDVLTLLLCNILDKQKVAENLTREELFFILDEAKLGRSAQSIFKYLLGNDFLIFSANGKYFLSAKSVSIVGIIGSNVAEIVKKTENIKASSSLVSHVAELEKAKVQHDEMILELDEIILQKEKALTELRKIQLLVSEFTEKEESLRKAMEQMSINVVKYEKIKEVLGDL